MGRIGVTSLVVVGLVLSACGSLSRVEEQPVAKAFRPTELAGRVGNRTSEAPWWMVSPDDGGEPTTEVTPIAVETFEISGDVLFEVGSAELSAASGSQLAHVLQLLRIHPDSTVDVIGHTDNTPGPTPDYNQVLSVDRAEAVARWLVNREVDPERISVDGRADREPIASNDTEAGRAINRRVSIRIVGGEASR